MSQSGPIFTIAFGVGASLMFAMLTPHLVLAFNVIRRTVYERRLYARLARGHDRYFEELRAIEAGKPADLPLDSFFVRFAKFFAAFLAFVVLDALIDTFFDFALFRSQ